MQKLFPMLLVILLVTSLHAATFQYPGNLLNFQRKGNQLLLSCDNATVEIYVIDSGIFRIRLLREGQADVGHSYAVVPQNRPAPDFRLVEEDRVLKLSTDEIILIIEKSPLRLAFYDDQEKLICRDHPSFGMGWNGNRVYCWKQIHDEPFYGLGEKTRGLNKRGNVYSMWNSDIPGYSATQDPLYQSHPFFMSLHQGNGFGIFLDNSYRSFFNFGAGNNQFYYFGAEDGVLDYYFINGPQLKTVLKRYGELVGTMPLPPKWALGYQQCRWSYFPDTEVIRLAQTFRDKKIPCDVLYLDIHYMDGYRVFTWHPDRFPDPKAMIQQLEQMGFKVVVIIDPGIKVDPNYHVYQQGVQGDHFCKYPDGTLYQGQVWPGWCHFPDFSKPDSRSWWGSLFKGLVDDGVRGFWTDMNEPATWGGTFPDNVLFDFEGSGADHLRMHNLYGLLMAKSTYQGLKQLRPNQRPFVITRAGFSGVQRYSSVWTGDNVASWEHLKLSMQMCLGLSLSGVAFSGPDIGGFMGAPTPELFTRWIQLGVFMPFFRTHTHHGSPPQDPWSYGDWYEDLNRKFIRLRYELLPYLYHAFYQSSLDNTPILKPMVLEYQSDPNVQWMDDQFMAGKNLLVAPVYLEKQTARKVYFPAGNWYDFWNDEKISGPQTRLISAPLDKIPIFVKAGAILPMQQAVDFIDSKITDPLMLHVFPGNEVVRDSLYEDDGASFDYLNGKYCITPFEFSTQNDQYQFTIDSRIGKLKLPARAMVTIFHDVGQKPKAVSLNGQPLAESVSVETLQQKTEAGYFFCEQSNQLFVKFIDDGKKVSLLIQ